MDPAARPDIDAEQLQTLLEVLQQGDIIDVGRGVSLFSPDVPSYPDEVEGVDHAEPILPHDFALPSGMCVVVSQDCDLRRSPDIEPYVLVAPMLQVVEDAHARARPGLTPRFFGFPAFTSVDGTDHEHLVADLRLVVSIEKLALLSEHVHRTPCPLSQPRRNDLRRWLGHRLGRVPFPDDVQRHVVDKVNDVVKRASRKEPTSRAVQCIAFIGITWTPGKSRCTMLVLTDPKARLEHKVGADELRAFKNRLDSGLARTGDYQLASAIRDATEASAAQLLEFHEITLEI